MHAAGMLQPRRGCNLTDTGSHFYDVYECADGGWLAVGPIEARFYAEFLQTLGVDPVALGLQNDPGAWPEAKALLAAKFRQQPRDHWASLFAATDACVTPVLDWDEATRHPHLASRGTFVEVDGVVQPAPAPRFSATPPATPVAPAPVTPENTRTALAQWLSPVEIEDWATRGLID
jgi:crotonobetainyl-CoA:carnitine CoA-transferase CaiB-like acyl-CoA transferase